MYIYIYTYIYLSIYIYIYTYALFSIKTYGTCKQAGGPVSPHGPRGEGGSGAGEPALREQRLDVPQPGLG